MTGGARELPTSSSPASPDRDDEGPDEVRAALPAGAWAPRGMTRSEALARSALGFALNSAINREQAAARLVELASTHARSLELARARILRACATGPIAAAAVDALQLALCCTGTTAQ